MARYRVLSSILFILAVTLAAAASAAQMQTTFQVSSSIAGSCSAVTATELAFGTYNGVQSDQTGIIAVTCTTGTAYEIYLDDGIHYSPPDRRMKHGTAAYYLNYDLYRDAGRTARWGNSDPDDIHVTGDGTAQNITVYGRMPAGQSGPVGDYADTITVTVTF